MAPILNIGSFRKIKKTFDISQNSLQNAKEEKQKEIYIFIYKTHVSQNYIIHIQKYKIE